MKTTSARQMAVTISALITALLFLLLAFLFNIIERGLVLQAIFSLLLVFTITFIAVNHLLHNFIFEKINPIYKTIQKLNYNEKELKRNLEEKDIIKEVNKEVIDWAHNKTIEIKKLKEQAQYRKEFLGNVSHELKTPIFNIQGYILTLLDGGLEDENINRLYLERTEKSINRMITIVEDLESISKLESGELKLTLERFNLLQIIKEIFEGNEMKAAERNIKLSIAHSEKPIWVMADKQGIYQALTNLVVNSINYGKQNGKTEVKFSEMGENILVEVIDDGIGIPENDISRIFERFYRVDKSRSRQQGGTGLGLAIVKHIIEAHKQTINVRSTVQQGTSFAFTLKKG